MDEVTTRGVSLILPVLFVLCGLGVVYLAAQSRLKEREMLHRERLAMIDRGLVPPPESDPARFHRATIGGVVKTGPRGVRYRSAGVIIIGFGFALMMLLTFTAEVPGVGIGVGGAFVILGAAFVINSFLHGQDAWPQQHQMAQAPPQPASTAAIDQPAGDGGQPPFDTRA